MNYNNFYKIQDKGISDVLEDSNSREAISLPITGNKYFENFKYNGSILSFAKYMPEYHPFTYVSKFSKGTEEDNINYFINNKNTSENKGACAKGFAPLMREQFSIESNSWNSSSVSNLVYKWVEFKYKWALTDPNDPDSVDPLKDGTMYVYSGTGEDSINTLVASFSCPPCIIMTIQGSGGGGAGGGTGAFGGNIRSYGGGCGPFCYLHLEMPYLGWSDRHAVDRSKPRNVMKVRLGCGGKGGNGGKSPDDSSDSGAGFDGRETWVYFYLYKPNNNIFGSYNQILVIPGGKGGTTHWIGNNPNRGVGEISTGVTTISSSSMASDLISSIGGIGEAGYGRITIVPNAREAFRTQYSYYSYAPGDYYSNSGSGFYWQGDWGVSGVIPRLSSGTDNLGKLVINSSQIYQPMTIGVDDWWAFGDRKNRSYPGLTSISGVGGAAGLRNDRVGKNGGYGAGGGAGYTDNSGGYGGKSIIKIYW